MSKVIGSLLILIGGSAMLPGYLWVFNVTLNSISGDQRATGGIVGFLLVFIGAAIGWMP